MSGKGEMAIIKKKLSRECFYLKFRRFQKKMSIFALKIYKTIKLI